jgi:hypothetical protein
MSAAREQELLDMIAARDVEIAALRHDNELLRRKVDHILRQLFGKKSEALDPAQLELLLEAGVAKKSVAAGDAPAAEPQAAASKHRRQRKPRDTSRLEVVEEVIVPAPVKACPEAWRKIDEAVSELLDYQPGKVLLRRIVRPCPATARPPSGTSGSSMIPPATAPRVRVGRVGRAGVTGGCEVGGLGLPAQCRRVC